MLAAHHPHPRVTSSNCCAVGLPSPLSCLNFTRLFTGEVKKLQEERDASRGVMMSLEDKNKQLQGTSAVSQGTFVSDLFTPGQLTGHQSRRAAKKRRLIHKPKGSNWHLQGEMGLTDDTVKYDRIIVRFFIISARGTNPQHASE